MDDKNKLVELLQEARAFFDHSKDIGELNKTYDDFCADYLIENGVKVGDQT